MMVRVHMPTGKLCSDKSSGQHTANVAAGSKADLSSVFVAACATKAAKSGKVRNVLDKVGQKMQGKKIVIWRERVAGLMRTDLAEAA
jgi:hypothetical protein